MDRSSADIRVWDPLVRLFHWSLVACVFTALVFEAGTDLHEAVGYGVAGLVAFRLVWGGIGTKYARFGDFVRPPAEVRRYLGSLRSPQARRYLGHNPAGGLMIVLLLGVLAVTAGTGVLLETDAFWGNALLEETHEVVANSLFVLIPIHLAGVVVSGLMHRENLVRAMITGRKRL